MAVVHMRIDNRLVHGQVTTSWVQSVGANHMIVCNDKVAVDPIQKIMLPQAARGVKTSVLSIADTLAACNSPQGEAEKIMVIAKLPADAVALLEGGLKPAEINVGNQAPIGGTKFKMVTNTVAVTAEDAALYRKVAGYGLTLTHKMMPSDRAGDFISLLQSKGM
ncbi:MAG: PTS system mannose/fructose/N-acetylgalactosamine-transporter subunit IIB [Symbiobacteriia bacterium]